MTKRYAQVRTIVFLCPDCGSDLAPAHVASGGEPVWRCMGCERSYVYGPVEWMLVQPGAQLERAQGAAE